MDYDMQSDPSREDVWQHIMERAESSIREVSHDEARALFAKSCGDHIDEFESHLIEGIDSATDKRLFFGSADEFRVFLYCPAIDRGLWWGHVGGVTARGLLEPTGRATARKILEKKGLL